MSQNIQTLTKSAPQPTTTKHKNTHHSQFPRKTLISLCLNTSLEKPISLPRGVSIQINQAPEILPRHGIDKIRPDLAADFTVCIQNVFVGKPQVDAH